MLYFFCLLVFLSSFLHCLHSSYLRAFLFILLLDGSGHASSREEHWPTWGWKGCPGRGYRELVTFVLILGWKGRKPLIYILFWQIAILCGFTVWGFFFVISPSTCCWETPPENTARLLVKPAEDSTKFSNILSIRKCCHSCLHQSPDEGKLPQSR